MRALLGLMLLGGLFLIAAGWQRGRTRDLREQREQQHGLPSLPRTASSQLGADWSLLVLGVVSGAEPIPGSIESNPADPTDQGLNPDPLQPGSEPYTEPPLPFGPDYRYEVQAGDFLGKICDRHYGTSRHALVDAVARYNGLPSPDAVRAGDTLVLPDRARLVE